MEHNLVLSDIMSTGYHPYLHNFLLSHSLPNQNFDFYENYYRMGFYDLKKYKRKFACLFHRPLLYNFEDYRIDLKKRIDKLISLGFKIIITEPWESKKTLLERNVDILFDTIGKKIDITYWIGGTSWFWFYMFEKHSNKKFSFNHNEKKFNFLYLNKTNRPHREKLFNKLSEAKLLNKSLYSFTSKGIELNKEYELPWATNPYPITGMDQDIYELPYNHSTVNIVSETQIDDEQFITEKIWKPIIAEQVFVVCAKPFYLKELRDLGFKTFDSIIDESYDTETNLDRRIDKIINLCKWINQQDSQDLYKKTYEVRKHNVQTFFNKTLLQKSMNDTLKKLLDFFDNNL